MNLDIYMPEKEVAIEYCCLFWHNERIRDKTYHKKKLNRCLKKGIKLITLFSDEWIFDQESTERRILLTLEGKEEDYYLHFVQNNQEIVSVDRRWSEGRFLEKYGYKLVETLEPKRWKMNPLSKRRNGLAEEGDVQENWLENMVSKFCMDVEEIDSNNVQHIWDCGWHVYKK